MISLYNKHLYIPLHNGIVQIAPLQDTTIMKISKYRYLCTNAGIKSKTSSEKAFFFFYFGPSLAVSGNEWIAAGESLGEEPWAGHIKRKRRGSDRGREKRGSIGDALLEF